MSSAAIKASKKSTKVAPVVVPDDDELDEKQIKQEISGFLAALVMATSQGSKLAYHISHHTEQDMLEIPELREVFPEERALQKKTKAKTSAKAVQLKAEISAFEEELSELKKTRKQLSKSSKRRAKSDLVDLDTTIEIYEGERKSLVADLEKLSVSDAYKTVYPVGANLPGDGTVGDKDWKILNKWAKEISKKSKQDQSHGIFSNLDLICDHLDFSKQERALLRLLA